MKLFSGTSNQNLSKKVSKLLKVPLSNVEVVRFGNSETKVTIRETVKNETCIIIQPTSNPTDTNLMELFFFCDALKREEAKQVIAVIPWFGYAKQNIQHRKGEAVSVNVVIEILQTIGYNKVYAFDLHDEATAGIFKIPFQNLSAFPFLAQKIGEYFDKKKISRDDVVLVSPDQGAVEKVRKFGNHFYKHRNFSEAVIEKLRDQNIPHKAKALNLYGNVKGKIALIVDDMVVSGSTLVPAVDLCLLRGATRTYATVVHHDFTKEAPEVLQNSKLERLFVTDSVALPKIQTFPKLEEISIALLIAEELKKIK